MHLTSSSKNFCNCSDSPDAEGKGCGVAAKPPHHTPLFSHTLSSYEFLKLYLNNGYNLIMITACDEHQSMVVGIAGGTGSGKTTLADLILKSMGHEKLAYIPHDAYYKDQKYLPFEERVKVNYDHPDSLETDLMVRQVCQLLAGKAIEMPVYDFTTHSRKDETVLIEPKPVILVEGILIFTEKDLRDLFDVKIFVDTDPDIRFIRRLTRDVEERGRTVQSVIDQYLKTVRPMHLEFVETSKRYADIIVPEGGLNVVALDMVIARLQSLLNGELPIEARRKNNSA
jgi:uridine kinase